MADGLGLKREIAQVAKDKGIDADEIIGALEEAMKQAARRERVPLMDCGAHVYFLDSAMQMQLTGEPSANRQDVGGRAMAAASCSPPPALPVIRRRAAAARGLRHRWRSRTGYRVPTSV